MKHSTVIDGAFTIDGYDRELDEPRALECAQQREHRGMLDRGRDHLAASRPLIDEPANHQRISLGAAAREDHLGGIAAEEQRQFGARLFDT